MAAKWYQKAADQGNATAQNNLGVLYQNGQGVEQSEEMAAKWYQKAADQGYAIAQNNLEMLLH
jgi:TPR repeat protein